MKKIIIIVLIAILILSLVGCTPKEDVESGTPTDIVAKVDDVEISVDLYLKNFKMLEYTYNQIYGEDIWNEEYQGRPVIDIITEKLINSLIEEELIRKKAIEFGVTVDQTKAESFYSEFKAVIDTDEDLKLYYEKNGLDEEFVRKQIDIQLLSEGMYIFVEEKIRNDEDFMEDMYENFRLEVRAKHILVASLDEADEVLNRIEAGEDFEEIAIEMSIDPGSKDSGGELGFFARNVMVAEFEKEAFSLDKEQVSNIVESEYGYHIIKVVDFTTFNSKVDEGLSEEEIENTKAYIASYNANLEIEEMILQAHDNAMIVIYLENIPEDILGSSEK